MTIQEFSSEFDILYNNIMSNAAPGLDEYEKSVFLTQAQEQLVVEIYDGRYSGESFENTEESRRYLSNIIKDVTLTTQVTGHTGVSKLSVFYEIPTDVWFRTYEAVTFSDDKLGCANGTTGLVKPVTQDEYYTLNRNPFKGPNERRVLRLDVSDRIIEVVSVYFIDSYYIRYLVKPDPIILDDLTQYDTSINGESGISECKLNPVLHRAILNRAVLLAKNAWSTGS